MKGEQLAQQSCDQKIIHSLCFVVSGSFTSRPVTRVEPRLRKDGIVCSITDAKHNMNIEQNIEIVYNC